MTDRIKPLRAIVAPDFTFELAERPQESLRQLRGKAAVLAGALHAAANRCRASASSRWTPRAYAAAGARVIARRCHRHRPPRMSLPETSAA